jgi:triacylglycerol lipase
MEYSQCQILQDAILERFNGFINILLAGKNISNKCKTKYPVVLIHGTGFRDSEFFNYWGRIPKALKAEGAEIFYANQDSWGTIENNAKTIKKSIDKLLLETCAEKVNLIAHSKGGLEARFLISSLGMEQKIASLTTISTPHNGTKTMDIFYNMPKWLHKFVSVFVDLWFKIVGDKEPDFYNASRQFSTHFCKTFNEQNANSNKVYYQSYATILNNIFSDILMAVPYIFTYLVEGENDGLVTPSSATWGNYKGVLKGATNRGISHADAVDFRRRKFTKKSVKNKISDIKCFYVNLVAELKELGF